MWRCGDSTGDGSPRACSHGQPSKRACALCLAAARREMKAVLAKKGRGSETLSAVAVVSRRFPFRCRYRPASNVRGLTGVDPGGPVSCSDPDQDRKSMSRLYFAMLRDCLDDLDALLSGSLKVAGDESLSEEDAHEYLLELIDWFLNEETVSPCSLDTVCVAVSADPVEVRRRVRLVLKREDTLLLKRRRLTPEELRDIRRLVFRQTTPELAENSK